MEFENDAECAKAEFQKLYVPTDISIEDNKIIAISLEENKMPSFETDGKWENSIKRLCI